MALRKSARLASPQARATLIDNPHRWDDWVPQERLRKLNEENIELSKNLKREMDAQRKATLSKPPPPPLSNRKRAFGSDLAGSSARGSEERASVAAAGPAPRGTKRGREYEGIDKVCHCYFVCCCGLNRNFSLLNRLSHTRPLWRCPIRTAGKTIFFS